MPHLSVRDLYILPNVPMSLAPIAVRELFPQLSEERAWSLVTDARHEATHLLASLACRGSDPILLQVLPSGPRRRSVAQAHTYESNYVQRAFVSFAGVAFEYYNAGADAARAHGAADAERGVCEAEWANVCPRHLLREAGKFVLVHWKLIDEAALGIILLMTRKGVLHATRLRHLSRYLRPKVRPFDHAAPRPPWR